MSTRLILVRHGETAASIDRRFAGSTNVELTENGRAQATELARRLKPIRIDAVYSSPLLRCRQTAEAISGTTGLKIRDAPEMVECHFGDWEGLTAQEVMTKDPDGFGSWIGDDAHCPPEGESWRQVDERVWAWWEDVSKRFADRTVLAVTHGGPILTILRHVLQTPNVARFILEIDPCSVTLLQTRGQFLRIRLMNDTSHMRDILRDGVPPEEIPP